MIYKTPLCVPIFLLFPFLFISFWCSQILSFIISFLFEGLTWPVFKGRAGTKKFLYFFFIGECFHLSFIPEGCFARYRIHSEHFFEQLKNDVALTSGFRREILCHSVWFSCRWYVTIPGWFPFFFLNFFFSFQKFNCHVLVWTSLGLICMLCVALLDLHVCVFHQTWEAFNHYFFKYSSSPFCLFLLYSGTTRIKLLDLFLFSHASLRHCSFLFSVDFPVLSKLGDSLFCPHAHGSCSVLSLLYCWAHPPSSCVGAMFSFFTIFL